MQIHVSCVLQVLARASACIRNTQALVFGNTLSYVAMLVAQVPAALISQQDSQQGPQQQQQQQQQQEGAQPQAQGLTALRMLRDNALTADCAANLRSYIKQLGRNCVARGMGPDGSTPAGEALLHFGLETLHQ